MKKIFRTYEEPIAGREFNLKQMREIHRDLANKEEYPDFNDWLHDMLKSGVFEEDEIPETPDKEMIYNGVSWSDFI